MATAIGYGTDVQDDFSGGAYPLVERDSVPANAFEDGVNCLISDDGQLVGRGGSAYVTDAPGTIFGSYPGTFTWDGYLAAGRRSLVIVNRTSLTSAGVYAIDPTTDNALEGLLATGDFSNRIRGRKPALLGGILFLPRGDHWAGALTGGGTPTPTMSGGSITLTQGSTTILGTGTAWTAAANVGLLLVDTAAGIEVAVKSITDATHAELTAPWTLPTYTTAAYATTLFATTMTGPTGAAYAGIDGFYIYAAVGDRMLAATGGSTTSDAAKAPANRVYMAERGLHREVLNTNYWDLPPGVIVTGIENARDTAIVFGSGGVWAIYNVSLALTDAAGNPQQRLEQLSRDLILWSWAGVATLGSELIVPAMDGIYRFNPTTGPAPIHAGILKLYRSYVDAGYVAGHAQVMRGHYWLPIVSPSTGQPIDLLSCRLTPTKRGGSLGWTRHGLPVSSLVVRATAGAKPVLRGMVASTARTASLSMFEPATVSTDYDGSTPSIAVTTREYRLGNPVKNFLSKLRARYELAGTTPAIAASQSTDAAAPAALSTTAPAATIATPFTWQVRKRGYGVRFVITVTGTAITNFVLHSLEAFIRPSGKS